MDLYLVRHGVAFKSDPTRWPDDRERPLTPDGKRRFRRAARGLATIAPTVDVVLSSPWLRAWSTAELLASVAGWPVPQACDALQAGRAPAEVLQSLQAFDERGALALVGHEPSLHELASYLLTAEAGHAAIEFRKGGVAWLEVQDGLRPGSARLRSLWQPKVLRALGS